MSSTRIKECYIDSKNKRLDKVVSIEHVNDLKTEINRKLKSKGKLRTGPFWTAYNRENLGSIPRKVENIIINEKTNNTKKGFLSNTSRFSDRNESVKYNIPGPGSYNSDATSTIDKSGISVYSSKGYGNGFIKGTSRFDDYSDYLQKYTPGPSDYLKTQADNFSSDKNIKYKSLYKKKEYVSLKETITTPGPGFYNPERLVTDNSKQNTTSNFFFKSTSKRFNMFGGNQEKIKDNSESNLNTMSNFFNNTNYTTFENTQYNNTNYTNNSNNNISNSTNYNKTFYNPIQPKEEKTIPKNKGLFPSITTYVFNFPNNKKLSSYNTEINNAVESAYVKGPRINHENKTLSHFFKPQSPQKEDILETHGIKTDKINTSKIKPGPGSYNIELGLGHTKTDFYQPNYEFMKFQREAKQNRLKTKPKRKKHIRKNDFYSTYSCFNVDKLSKNLSCTFASNSPKNKSEFNQLPGPCYYSPTISPSKTSFNNNKNNVWMAI